MYVFDVIHRRWGRAGRKLPGALVLLGLFLVSTSASAQVESLEETERQFQAVLERATQLARETQRQIKPLPEGQTRVLKAVVMSVKGRAQWRPTAEAPWQVAQVDDLLEPAAEIRTSIGASMALRIGHNASLLVGQGSRVVIPDMAHDGDTLRTTIQLIRGRTDFKVDRVGMNNDFSIVTPSTTLAVRGSTLRVEYGGLLGTETIASPSNELDSVEVRYFLTKLTAYLSGGARTSDDLQDPVLASLFESFAPPGMLSAFLQTLIDEGGTLDPDDWLLEILDLDYEDFEQIVDPGTFFLVGPCSESDGEIGPAAPQQQGEITPCTICHNLLSIVFAWRGLLEAEEIGSLSVGPTFLTLRDLTCGVIDPLEYGSFFEEINRMCHDHTTNPALCVELFGQAVNDTIHAP